MIRGSSGGLAAAPPPRRAAVLPARRGGTFLAALLAAASARAAPPPLDSADSYDLSPYAAWIEAQRDSRGWLCCSIADGREVEARQSAGGGYEVRFLHPEDIIGQPQPDAHTWYPVPPQAVISAPNPTHVSVAWWYTLGAPAQGSPIRCFAPGELY